MMVLKHLYNEEQMARKSVSNLNRFELSHLRYFPYRDREEIRINISIWATAHLPLPLPKML